MSSKARTLYEKIWDAHVVSRRDDGTCLIYVDRHLVHEVTSPQAFEGLRVAGRKVRRPDLTLAVPDHNLPTTARVDAHGHRIPIADPESANQLAALRRNAPEFGIRLFDEIAPEQGIVHVIGPEQGFTLPGTTLVCGDSHTAAHGALGSLAFGIGTSEVEHVLATQTLLLKQSKTMEIRVDGTLGFGVSPKDVILAIVGKVGAAGGTGYVVEYTGEVIRAMSIEGRLTVSNMAIEHGARSGLIAPDETTFAYLAGRPMAPQGDEWTNAVDYWRTLPSDVGAVYDKVVLLHADEIAPSLTWGTSPEDVVPITGIVPDPMSFADPSKQEAARKSLDYMGLAPGTRMQDVGVENIFIGSCTNSRIEDLRAAAAVAKGRKVANTIRQALVVPGSGLVKRQAEAEGLDRIFIEAGFQWREPGCSMCLAMNPDKVPAGERCASTSNRNFVGRQGPGARTHLVSPAMAAAAAVTGRLTDVRELMGVSAQPLKAAFPASVDAHTRLLVLGSLPGEVSLAARQYYANPTNQFWRLLGGVIGEDLLDLGYAARLDRLLAHGIGLWDVIQSAHRVGSLDTAIRDHQARDLRAFVADLPNLRAIAFNGGKAAAIGRKQWATEDGAITLVDLPSSSAAFCSISLDAKQARWLALKSHLGSI